jgi:hypothetical protein
MGEPADPRAGVGRGRRPRLHARRLDWVLGERAEEARAAAPVSSDVEASTVFLQSDGVARAATIAPPQRLSVRSGARAALAAVAVRAPFFTTMTLGWMRPEGAGGRVRGSTSRRP